MYSKAVSLRPQYSSKKLKRSPKYFPNRSTIEASVNI